MDQFKQANTLPPLIDVVLQNTKQLNYSRENRLPLYVWTMMDVCQGLDDSLTLFVLNELKNRGIAMISSWHPEQKQKTLRQGLRIAQKQQSLNLDVNINANACLNSFFNGDSSTFHIDQKGHTFYDDSFSKNIKMGCPFALKHRYPAISEQLDFFLQAYKENNITIDFIFADWEIDGPLEWNDAWENSKKCVRCCENIQDIHNFEKFQNELRLIRCDMQKQAFVQTVKKYFPQARIGNYGVYPHDGYRYWFDYYERQDDNLPGKIEQKAKYRIWFHEFDKTGYNCAMPVVYSWYPIFFWYDFENTDYRWFYNMLLVATNAAQNSSNNTPIISFVHKSITAPPPVPDKTVAALSEEMYEELLWHMLFRGVDVFFLWCLDDELADEIKPLHKVYSEALQYKEFFNGEPICYDVPDKQGTVISGLLLGEQVLVRRTDFEKSEKILQFPVGTKILHIPYQKASNQLLILQNMN